MSGQVEFFDGEFTKNITIPIMVDSDKEQEEIFDVELAVDCCDDILIGRVQVNIIDGN